MYSVDSAFKRLDSQDKEIIQHVLSKDWEFKRAMILGSGRGRIGVVLALMGFEVVCIDIEDHEKFYKSISQELQLGDALSFIQADLLSTDISRLSSRRTIVIAQRVFQYLPNTRTRTLVREIHKNMLERADLYINVSSVATVYGKSYSCLTKPIEERFCIPESLAEGLEVAAPMCLYSELELLQLFDKDFWLLESLENNAFGNIKAHFTRV